MPLRSLNRLKLSVLQGYGQHELVAKLQTTKRLIFLGSIFVLLLIRDDLLFKTIDGNDISLDVIIAYRIDPQQAPKILQFVATAKGIQEMNNAMTGSGGGALVKLRIAEAIQGKRIILLPISEGGMNLKTTDINQLIGTMGVRALAGQ